MRDSRCFALPAIFVRYSLVLSESPGSFNAMLSRPMMAFIGVLISWLMELKNAVFATFACSASWSAFASISFLSF